MRVTSRVRIINIHHALNSITEIVTSDWLRHSLYQFSCWLYFHIIMLPEPVAEWVTEDCVPWEVAQRWSIWLTMEPRVSYTDPPRTRESARSSKPRQPDMQTFALNVTEDWARTSQSYLRSSWTSAAYAGCSWFGYKLNVRQLHLNKSKTIFLFHLRIF